MYILSVTRPINFSYGFGYGSSMSSSKYCSSRTWMNGNYGIKHITNIVSRSDKMNLRRVCSGNSDLELQPFNEKSKIEESMECIKEMLRSMDDGAISVSAYDTAWIALINDHRPINITAPHFPSSLDWIASNQLSDGSWGNDDVFVPCDRLLTTLACVVALRTWNVYPNNSERGIVFVKENISKLEVDDDAQTTITTLGFEFLFPAFLERAGNLGIEGLPYDDPIAQKLCAMRRRELQRISSEVKEKVAASSLLILEGLGVSDWENILKLQSPDGSFVASPSTTAFVFMETKDENCLRYIKKAAESFGGGAPSLYPVDIFTRLWAVDTLQRLGISRFFQSEIEDCLSYIYRFWTEKGVFCGRDSEICDINDTSMGFRLLRLHGYNVSPNVFINFKKDDKFSLYGDDEMVDSPSTILNLYRASQVLFPGEAILEEANEFSHNFLQQKHSTNQLFDKCLISKNLHTEIKYGLETPWYASLPRLDAQFFIEHYSVDNQVRIGKSLYRLPDINKDRYLEVAKSDYNRCQEQHQMEWNHLQQWYEDCNLEEFGISIKEILEAHFFAVASIFEPERLGERVAWVKSQIMFHILSTYYSMKQSDHQTEFSTAVYTKIQVDGQRGKGFKNVQRIITILFEALTQLKKDARERSNGDISDDLLHEAWGGWLKKLGEGTEMQEVEVIVRTINICGGHILSKDVLAHHEYKTLSQLTNRICDHLLKLENQKMIGEEIEKEMQLLVQLVLQGSSNGISKAIKETFLVVAKTFYHRAYFSAPQIENHISITLFQQLL